jgi:hypothetical protein
LAGEQSVKVIVASVPPAELHSTVALDELDVLDVLDVLDELDELDEPQAAASRATAARPATTRSLLDMFSPG